MDTFREKPRNRLRGFLQYAAGVLLCLLCLPSVSLAENIVWYGPGDPANTGAIRNGRLYPDGPSGNSVTVNGDLAAYVQGGVSSGGTSEGNTVIVNKGFVSGYIDGGTATNGDAVNNRVIINGGSVGNTAGGYSSGGNTNGNSITINSGIAREELNGGFAMWSGNAVNNTVTLSGSPVFSASHAIYGGGGGGDIFTGNTLNIWNYAGTTTTNKVERFQFYNFHLGATSQPLRVGAGGANFGNGAGKDSMVSGVSFSSAVTPQSGQKFVLLSSGAYSGSLGNLGQLEASKGVTVLYSGLLELNGSDLTYTVTNGGRANPRAKALPEGRAAGMAFVNQGADLAAGAGISAAASAGTGTGLSGFTAFQGGSRRYNTGSHVDVDGFRSFWGGSSIIKVAQERGRFHCY